MSELRECPYCGGKADLIDHRVDWFVKCSDCNVIVYGESVSHLDHIEDEKEAKEAFNSVDWDALKQTAIDKWNTRSESALTEINRLLNLECEGLKGDIERLKEVLASIIIADEMIHDGINVHGGMSMMTGSMDVAKKLLDK